MSNAPLAKPTTHSPAVCRGGVVASRLDFSAYRVVTGGRGGRWNDDDDVEEEEEEEEEERRLPAVVEETAAR